MHPPLLAPRLPLPPERPRAASSGPGFHRRALLPLLLLLASCGVPAQAPPQAAKAPAPPAPSTSTSASAAVPTPSASAAVVAPEEPALPLPETPPGADPEKVAIAASICAASALPDVWDKGKLRVGCRSHPPFTRPEQKPDGKLELSGDQLEMCSIDRIYRGSFTKPGSTQLLLAFSQCKEDDASWDMGNPGSAVVVEQVNGRYRVVAYEPDVNIELCTMYKRADARDGFVCENSFAAIFAAGTLWFTVMDFGREEGKRTTRMGAVFFDDFDASCDPTNIQGFLEYGVIRARITDVSFCDVNHDGKLDLVARIERARFAPGAALSAKIRKLCGKATDKNIPPDAYLPKPVTSTLEFLGDGDRFTPSLTTQKMLKTWEAEAPEASFLMP